MASAFSAEERAAMKAAAAEAKAAKEGADQEAACRAAIDAMTGTDKQLAEILDSVIRKNTPLTAKTWYGMPAYMNAEGKTIVFFQAAAKFKVRYATIGFQPDAQLDEGNFWPNAYAVTKLDADDQKALAKLLTKAIG
jgi:uncharacterized protein YdhG (YjbR/CyaY superfamily)